MATVPELMTRINEKAQAVRELWDKSDDNGGDMPDADRKRVTDLNKEIDELERQAKDLSDRDANAERIGQLNGKPTSMIRFPNAPGGGGAGERDSKAIERKSMGQLFVDSDEWQTYLKERGSSLTSQRARVQSPPVEAKGLLTSVTMAPLIEPDVQPMLPYQWPPIEIFNVITNGTTTSDTIEFVRQLEPENNAAPVAEATDVSGTSGIKPMSNMAFEPDSTTVKTIAHWIPGTKRVLADVQQLRTMIDAFLREGLRQELAAQVIDGDGTGENFRGIMNTPGLSGPATGADMLAATRRARTIVRITGRATPNAFVLNPVDWEAIDLLQMATGQFFFGGPSVLGTPRLWGLPVVEEEAMPQGTGLCGDFRTCVLWNREQATISATDSHADFFIRNLVAILGELRAAFAVLRPPAICTIEGLTGTPLPAPGGNGGGTNGGDSGTRSTAPVSSSTTSGGGTTPRSTPK